MAQVMSAGLGTRIYYTMHGSFDTHSNELPAHAKLWTDVSTAIADFTSDLEEHGLARRHADPGVLRVRPAHPGQRHRHRPRLPAAWPSLPAARSTAASTANTRPCAPKTTPKATSTSPTTSAPPTPTILSRWLELDPVPIVHGVYEQFDFL